MQTVDWIVVGNGLAGAALSYELVRQGHAVILIDEGSPDSATRWSYGGIAYWSGTSALTRELFAAGIERHRGLSAELGADTEFRELDLLLTIPADQDAGAVAQPYQQFAMPPQLISVADAVALEPQLDPTAIAGALTVKHGHVHPLKLVTALNQAFRKLGGQQMIATVTGLVRVGERITGVMTPTQAYAAGQVAIATGGYSRALLQSIQVSVPLYHTHAEIVAVPPITPTLRALIMPAIAQRFPAEAQVSQPDTNPLWAEPGHELSPPILDAGVIQFLDHSVIIGQISRFCTTTTDLPIDAAASEAQLRAAISQQLPALKTVPGTWHRCLVTFSRDGLPLIGPVPSLTGLHLFAGFTSPFAMLLPIAERFARWTSGAADDLIETMQVKRFEKEVIIRP
jgi:glycine/D-amino acid oxidase-like deaminating enzyme